MKHLSRAPSIPRCVYYGSITTADPYTKANSFLKSVFTTSTFVLPPMCQLPTPSAQLSSIDISSEDVYSSLKPDKAFGCDQINCASSFVKISITLFHESLINGRVPSEWKVHKITPLFKAGDNRCVENY